ncbi:MAG TPA: cupin domain-containing protein [Miltoncostaeaceae bacterium]|jgi:quercetin dioxygenase-like cupin family protein|nr:cupin domain-containing protein [Miltoncostaeaceae bacterium]
MGLVRRRGSGWSWDGVAPRRYEAGAERHVLVSSADGAADVELRYFRIPPGGASALERHAHEHAILVLHGRGEVLLGDVVHPVGEGDAVFVQSEELHQLRALDHEALGFLCTALVSRGLAHDRPSTSAAPGHATESARAPAGDRIAKPQAAPGG